LFAVLLGFATAPLTRGEDLRSSAAPSTPEAPASEGSESTGDSVSSDSRRPAPADAVGGASASEGLEEKEAEPKKPRRGELAQATFGGGCFWCIEAVFQRVPGVRSVVSGYSGGNVLFPSYELVSSGATGHAEVVQVTFEPAVVSYETLLEVFWRSHDPTTPNAQGPDVGTQYRSIILYHNDDQRKAIGRVYRALKARRVLRGSVVTQVVPFQVFFPAEAYHQNYYNNHPFDPYSMVYIAPKFDVFRKMRGGAAKKKPAAKERGTAISPASPENRSAPTSGRR
jgi:peptide-methionine (S)-S-oxide reductase